MARSALTVALTIAALASVASCAKREHAVNPQSPLWLHRPGWALSLAFRRPLVDDTSIARTSTERSTPAIDPRHGRVFVGTSDRGLYALRAADGSVLWRFATAGGVHSEPLYDEARDVVYFGSDDDGLYALRASDGSLLFRYRTGAEVQRRPVLVAREGGKAILLFDNAADGVFAIDADTGQTKWKHVRNPAMGLELVGHAGVAYANERVYCAFSTGRVVAYDLETGKERWSEVDLTTVGVAADSEQQPYFDIDTTPLVVGDKVYVANVTTGVFALDASAGTPSWRRPEAEGVSWLSHWAEPAHVDPASGAEVPARSLVVAGSGTTGLWALDPKTGDVKWRREAPRGTLGHPVPLAGALLVTSSKLGMFLLEPQQGRPIDGFNPGTGFSAGAAAYGNKAFVLTNAGVLLGLEVVPPSREPTTAKSW
jgi:outer membrane protein assembly factor BamB